MAKDGKRVVRVCCNIPHTLLKALKDRFPTAVTQSDRIRRAVEAAVEPSQAGNGR